MVSLREIDTSVLGKTKWYGLSPDEWLQSVVSIHFDPDYGSQYWLDREKELGIKIIKKIKNGEIKEEDIDENNQEQFDIFINSIGLNLGKELSTDEYSVEFFGSSLGKNYRGFFSKRRYDCRFLYGFWDNWGGC